MTYRRKTKYIHESGYVAEVEVDVVEDDSSWSPYLSVFDARRLDEVREALRRGDLQSAAAQARVFIMQPIPASR